MHVVQGSCPKEGVPIYAAGRRPSIEEGVEMNTQVYIKMVTVKVLTRITKSIENSRVST